MFRVVVWYICCTGHMLDGMDVPKRANTYAPGVGLRIASDYFCEGKKKKNYMSLLELTLILMSSEIKSSARGGGSI